MKTITTLALAIFITGCATQQKFTLDTTKTSGIVLGDVLSIKCQKYENNRGEWNKYRLSASRLLSVAEVDSTHYEESYKKLTNHIEKMPEPQFKKSCEDYAPKLAKQSDAMEQDYLYYISRIDEDNKKYAEMWSNAIAAIATTAAVVNAASVGFSNTPVTYIPMPSGRVDFGKNTANRTPAYLINTPSGIKQCRISGSNYIFCN